MSKRHLLVSTFGKEMGELITGLRNIRHDHMMVVVGKEDAVRDELREARSLLDKLRVSYEVLIVDTLDIIGTSVAIEKAVRARQGWQVAVDITGGGKLLSDAAVLAAVATGSEVHCHEVGARRFSLLKGMGVAEALPREVRDVLITQQWPVHLEGIKGRGPNNPLARTLLVMKGMDLVAAGRSGGRPCLQLTDRGRACMEWLERMDPVT